MEYNRDNIHTLELLAFDDVVVFSYKGKDYSHIVKSFYLEKKGNSNDILFIVTNINKVTFAEEFYGYPLEGDGKWPQYKNKDYAAATRLVKGLFEKIDELEGVIKDKFINNYSIY